MGTVAIIKPPAGPPSDREYPQAFRADQLDGRYPGGQILCRDCALGYVEKDNYEVNPATYKEVSDAFLRISTDLIGRIGPVSERVAACYECEEEL